MNQLFATYTWRQVSMSNTDCLPLLTRQQFPRLFAENSALGASPSILKPHTTIKITQTVCTLKTAVADWLVQQQS
jgi:hypothetical protein